MNSHASRTQSDIDRERDHLLHVAYRFAEAAALVHQAADKLGILAPNDHLALKREARELDRKCAEIVVDAYAEES